MTSCSAERYLCDIRRKLYATTSLPMVGTGKQAELVLIPCCVRYDTSHLLEMMCLYFVRVSMRRQRTHSLMCLRTRFRVPAVPASDAARVVLITISHRDSTIHMQCCSQQHIIPRSSPGQQIRHMSWSP